MLGPPVLVVVDCVAAEEVIAFSRGTEVGVIMFDEEEDEEGNEDENEEELY